MSGKLETVLRAGGFAVTAQLSPVDSADASALFEGAAILSPLCDAINAAGAVHATTHMSSIGACGLLSRDGHSLVLQVTCRDRNRIAIQGDVLAAAAMGVDNVLCLTGDAPQVGDEPGARPVFDFDSISLLEALRDLRDEARFMSGRPLGVPPALFLGAAVNPFAPPLDFRPLRLAKKIEAGAQFVQTQLCFDVPLFARYMERVRDLGLNQRCYILVSVGPLASVEAALSMRKTLPGIHIPEAVIDRLKGAADPQREGVNICIETIQQLKEISGVAGIHVIAWRREDLAAQIIADSGVR